MRNEYRDLKKENDLIFSTLAEYDRDTITDILDTVNNTRGLGYEVELVRKDLITMAAQAEARRDYLPSVIGDVDVFKRNLLASMPRPKLADYMADSLVGLCTFALASTATFTVLGSPWDCPTRRGLACALHCHYDAQCVAAAALCPRRVGGLHRKRCAVRCHYSRHDAFVVRGVLVRRQMDHAAAARGGPAQPCGSHPVRRGTGSAAYLAQPSPQRACRKTALAGCDGEIKKSRRISVGIFYCSRLKAWGGRSRAPHLQRWFWVACRAG